LDKSEFLSSLVLSQIQPTSAIKSVRQKKCKTLAKACWSQSLHPPALGTRLRSSTASVVTRLQQGTRAATLGREGPSRSPQTGHSCHVATAQCRGLLHI